MGGIADQIIAVVDDDAGVRRSLDNLFRSLGFAVETFGSAEDFLQSGRLEDTACLILDLRMPEMRRPGSSSHVVDSSRMRAANDCRYRAQLSRRARALSAGGAIAFMEKPLDAGTLIHAVKAVAGGARQRPGVPICPPDS